MEGNKFCNTCKETKTYNDFYKHKNKKGGLDSRCKQCAKKYRDKNKVKISEFNKRYWDENKELQKSRIAKWRKENAEHIRQYRKENKERDKKRAREWYNTDKGRALKMTQTTRYRSRKKKLETKFTAKEWISCKEVFDDKCCYCGEQSELSLEQDHFVPVNSNGPLVKSNIVPACRSCNASKSDKDFFQWYPANENYSYERMVKILDYLNIDKNTILIVDKN